MEWYTYGTIEGAWIEGTYDFCATVTVPDCAGAPWDLSWETMNYPSEVNRSTGVLQLGCVNETAPVAGDDAFVVPRNSTESALNVLANDTDVNGDPLSVSAVGVPDQGGVALNAGTYISYTPGLDFLGTEVFTYTASDGRGGFDTALVMVTVENDLAMHLPLDEAVGATTFADASGNGYDLACWDSACPTAGVAGKLNAAVQFDGSNDVIGRTLVTPRTDDVGLAAWVRWAGAPGAYQAIVYNGNTAQDGYGLYVDPAGYLAIIIGGEGSVASTATLGPNWRHVAAVRDNGTWKLYLDGSQVATTGNPLPNAPTGRTAVGARPQDGLDNFAGQIDDVRLYSRVLSAAEIAALASIAPEISVSPLGLDFGQQDAEAGPTTSQTVLITNDGTANLFIASVSLAGAHAAEFVISGDTGETALYPGASRSVQVAFDPETGGVKSASLRIVSDDADEGSLDVALGGTAIGLVLHLPLDEAVGATTFVDTSSNGNDGACSGASCPVAGEAGKLDAATQLDGVDDEITVADALLLRSNRFSLSLWFWWDGLGTDGVSFLTAKGLENMELHTGGSAGVNGLRFIPAGPSTIVDATGAIALGWNHVAATYDGSAAYLYVNGTLAGSRTGIVGGNDLLADANAFHVGRRADATFPFAGRIDDVRLYNRVLASAELQALAAIAPEVSVAPLSLDFGSQEADAGATASQTVVITNEGTANLFITGLSPTGTHAGEFAITADTGETVLYPGASRSVQVAFDPETGGIKSANLHIVSDDPDESSLDVALSGTGIGLVLHLPLDEATGATTFADTSDNGYDGTCSGASCPVAGEAGRLDQAVHFDGSNDDITVADAPSLRIDRFSLSLWFRWDGLGTSDINFLTAKGLENMELHTGGETGVNGLRFIPAGYPATHVDATGVITTGWNHVAATYDGSTAYLYVNGALAGSRIGIVSGNDLLADSTNFHVGQRSDASSPFAGQIDDVRLYNRVLSAAEIAALASIAPEISVSPLGLDFGQQDAEAGPTTSQTVLITNDGTANLFIASVSLAGAHAAEFVISGDTGETALYPGTSRSVQVAFDPETVGDKSASLRIVSDDADEGTLDIALGGTAIGLVLHLPLDEAVGATTFVDTSSNGNDGACSGASCPVAGEAGKLNAATQLDGVDDEITVADALLLRSNRFSLSLWFWWDGLGTDGVSFLTAKGLENMEMHTGGSAGVNGLRFIPAGPSTIVDATGAIALGWNHVAATYDGSAAYLYVNGTLAGSRTGIAGGNDLLTDANAFHVGRRADATFPFAGRIDDVRLYNRVLASAELQALAAIAPEVSAAPLSLDFGSQEADAGATASQTVVITNEGTANLFITGLSLTGTHAGEFAITADTGETVLYPGTSRSVQVAFDPDSSGSKMTTLTVTSDDADEGTLPVAVTGIGLGAEITVAPLSLDFGEQNVNAGPTVSQTVAIANDGTLDLHINAITPSGNVDQFSLSDSGQSTLAPGATRTLEVAFDPDILSHPVMTLTIASDDTDEGTLDVLVTGISVRPVVTVTTASDADDGLCDADCSLREALALVATGGLIGFDPGLAGQTIVLAGQLDANKDLTIDGSSLSAHVKISGNDAVRVFHVGSGCNVTLTHLDIVDGNAAGNVGGGIHNQGTLTLNHSTLSGNRAVYGGGIFNYYGTLTLNHSTLSGNSVTVHGGGVYNQLATLTLNHSTLSGNSAALSGGGIYDEKGALTLNHSTLTANVADSDGNGTGDGGGVNNWGGTVNFRNSLVAGNDDLSTPGYDDCVGGGGISQGYNLTGDGTGCNLAGSGDQTTSDPRLAALADNGGSTWTHALLAGSPALNAIPDGSNGCGSDYRGDQRGVPRPVGGACDVGAYEAGGTIWDGGGSDSYWSTVANWSEDTAPTPASVVVFNDTSDADAVMDTPFTVAGLFIGDDYDGAIDAGGYDLAIDGTYEQSGGSLTAPAGLMTVSGDLCHGGGTFDANGGTVVFDGAVEQTLDAAAITFHNLAVQGGSTVVDVAGLAASGALTNDGTLRRSQEVNGTSDVAFFNTGGYGGLILNANGTDLGSTTVEIRGNQDCTTVPGETVRRCFDVAPQTTSGANATLRLYFSAGELGSIPCSDVHAWHWNGSAWETAGTNPERQCSGPYYVQVAGVGSFSPFVAADDRPGQNPTAVTLASFRAAAEQGAVLLGWETASEVGLLGFHLYRAEAVDGPQVRLNEGLISAQAPGSPGGVVYTWRDEAVAVGVTYHYWLEHVDLHGLATRTGPVSVTVTTPPAHISYLPMVYRASP